MGKVLFFEYFKIIENADACLKYYVDTDINIEVGLQLNHFGMAIFFYFNTLPL